MSQTAQYQKTGMQVLYRPIVEVTLHQVKAHAHAS
jgi:hypothetical protein